jgi:hypothetical protein
MDRTKSETIRERDNMPNKSGIHKYALYLGVSKDEAIP